MKNKLKNIKVGQKVYSITYGSGRVKELFDGVFTVQFPACVKVNDNKKVGIVFEDFAFKYNGAPEESWTNNPEVFLKKPVITTKARINHLTDQALRNGTFKGQLMPRKIGVLLSHADSITFGSDFKGDKREQRTKHLPEIKGFNWDCLSDSDREELVSWIEYSSEMILTDIQKEMMLCLLRKGGLDV